MRFFMSDLRQDAAVVGEGAARVARMRAVFSYFTDSNGLAELWRLMALHVPPPVNLYGILLWRCFVWDFTMEMLCMGFYYGCMESDQRLFINARALTGRDEAELEAGRAVERRARYEHELARATRPLCQTPLWRYRAAIRDRSLR